MKGILAEHLCIILRVTGVTTGPDRRRLSRDNLLRSLALGPYPAVNYCENRSPSLLGVPGQPAYEPSFLKPEPALALSVGRGVALK